MVETSQEHGGETGSLVAHEFIYFTGAIDDSDPAQPNAKWRVIRPPCPVRRGSVVPHSHWQLGVGKPTDDTTRALLNFVMSTIQSP